MSVTDIIYVILKKKSNTAGYKYLYKKPTVKVYFLMLFTLLTVEGVAKHIDWFGPSGDKIEPYRPDITVTRNDESSSTLTLYGARNENAGTYKCAATNGDQQGEATVKVKIFRKFFIR